MKKHMIPAALLLAAALSAGSLQMVFAGPADELTAAAENGNAAAPTAAPMASDANNAAREQAPNPGTTLETPASALPVTVNYEHDSYGLVTTINMTLDGYDKIGGISYRAYNTAGGFLWWYHDGIATGPSFESNNITAMQVVLTGYAELDYDVWYRATSTGQGQMGWATNGEIAGTIELGETLSSIEVIVLPKGSPAPQGNGVPRYKSNVTGRLKVSDGGTTMINADGSPYNGWLDEEHIRYYFVDGHAVTGWQYIDGYKYYFENNGVLRQNVEDLVGKQDRYEIRVNKLLDCATVYAKDGDNGFILPLFAMRTSHGEDTPIGTFYTPEKFRWHLMIDDSYTQWTTRITQGFMMHSITYASTNNMDLNVVGYNRLGVSRSHGCIRLTAANSKWVYDNCVLGTPITIYEDPDSPGPFPQPELITVSEAQRWDPTDPTVVLN